MTSPHSPSPHSLPLRFCNPAVPRKVECADVLVLNKMDTIDEDKQELLTEVCACGAHLLVLCLPPLPSPLRRNKHGTILTPPSRLCLDDGCLVSLGCRN